MKLFLPTPVGERYEIIKKLRKLNVFVAGWEITDIVQLRDMLQEEEELARKKRIAKTPLSVAKRKEVGKALKEYREYLEVRKSAQHKF